MFIHFGCFDVICIVFLILKIPSFSALNVYDCSLIILLIVLKFSSSNFYIKILNYAKETFCPILTVFFAICMEVLSMD